MKRLHRKDLYGWSEFQEPLNIDFNGVAWIREGGNLLIDPLPMSDHDRKHLRDRGGAAHSLLTNSDHVRGTVDLAREFGAIILGPRAERDDFPVACSRWVGEGDVVFPGLVAFEMQGSKTPGELALLLGEDTLITGDLIRAHRAGSLMMLSREQGLQDSARAVASIERFLSLPRLAHVIPCDGWPLFHDARRQMEVLVRPGPRT